MWSLRQGLPGTAAPGCLEEGLLGWLKWDCIKAVRWKACFPPGQQHSSLFPGEVMHSGMLRAPLSLPGTPGSVFLEILPPCSNQKKDCACWLPAWVWKQSHVKHIFLRGFGEGWQWGAPALTPAHQQGEDYRKHWGQGVSPSFLWCLQPAHHL